MTEGWWVNYETRRFLGLYCPGMEHEIVIRDHKNQDWLGVPPSVAKAFNRYRPQVDRIRFLLYVMKHVPLMRIRGYGCRVQIQYWCPGGDDKPYAAVRRWAARWGGPRLLLEVSNLATRRHEHVMAGDWPAFVKRLAKTRQGCSNKGLKTGYENRRNFRTFGKTRTVRKDGRRAERIREAT